MESSQDQAGSLELVIPLWDIGPSLPPGMERRRDRGAVDRHVQARTGVAPEKAVLRRRPPRAQRPEQVVTLWLESEEGLKRRPAAVAVAQFPTVTGAADPLWGDDTSPEHAAAQATITTEELQPSCDGDQSRQDASDGQPRRSIYACRGLLSSAAAWIGVTAEAP